MTALRYDVAIGGRCDPTGNRATLQVEVNEEKKRPITLAAKRRRSA